MRKTLCELLPKLDIAFIEGVFNTTTIVAPRNLATRPRLEQQLIDESTFEKCGCVPLQEVGLQLTDMQEHAEAQGKELKFVAVYSGVLDDVWKQFDNEGEAGKAERVQQFVASGDGSILLSKAAARAGYGTEQSPKIKDFITDQGVVFAVQA